MNILKNFILYFRPKASYKKACEHIWEYLPREKDETYTGYCERCVKCGEISQIVQ